MSDSPHKSPFPAGFERDGKILLLALDAHAISRPEFRRNFARLGVELDRDPDPSRLQVETPRLERLSLHEPDPEPVFYAFEDDADHVWEANTGAVFNVQTGEHVGFLEQESEPVAELEEGEEPEPELIPDAESPGIVIPADDEDEEDEDEDE